jgi:hypothetical protein
MATKRQIAANRGNAGKSTGPRSPAGKKRAGRNAYRHGLSVSLLSNAAVAKQIEKLARKVAGKTNSEIILEHARDAVQAAIDVARARRSPSSNACPRSAPLRRRSCSVRFAKPIDS